MINFTKIKLGDVGDITTGRTPNTSDAENYGSEYMFLGPTDLHKHFIVTKSEKYITGKGLASVNSSVIDGLSICVGCIGWDMGNVALVNEKCATNQQINSITKVKDEYNPYYIYYWLKGKKDFLFQQANVTRTPILNKTDFSNIDIWLPSKSQQDKIANILSTIDEKIEVNNKISAKLEAMAKLIYDYWFVQFDFPDENGKPYKSSGGKMVYNEELKREIPDGWEVKELSDIANITMGQSPSGSSYNDSGEGAIFFQGSTDFGYRFPSVRQYTTEPNRLAKKGDILLSVRAPVGTLNIADNDCCIGRGLAGLNSKDNTDSFLFYVMLYFKQIFDRRNSLGTTFGSITKDDLFSLKLVYPSSNILLNYDNKVSDFTVKILNNHQQNKELIRLKDWLLPMLMNGQATIK
jgi:type I restriction enzyme S subunit